jgi:hypothetical protein
MMLPPTAAWRFYQAVSSSAPNSPGTSFATYAVKFQTAGTYTLYLRWRADAVRSAQDQNGANSYYLPIDFGDLETTDGADFGTSSANNSRLPPAANNYDWIGE